MRQSVCASLEGAWNQGTSRLGSRIQWAGAVFIVLAVAGFSPADDAIDKPSLPEQIAAGQELFLREWKVGDPRAVPGDGLGPMYNAASCVKCHRLGGVGGAGANEDNVDLLTVKVPNGKSVVDDDLRRRVAAFYPATGDTGS